jgi:hypothetical protein
MLALWPCRPAGIGSNRGPALAISDDWSRSFKNFLAEVNDHRMRLAGHATEQRHELVNPVEREPFDQLIESQNDLISLRRTAKTGNGEVAFAVGDLSNASN